MKKLCFFSSVIAVLNLALLPITAQEEKPLVIVITDGEIDDHNSSMIRFLQYTCDIDLLGINNTNFIFEKDEHRDKDWYEKQLSSYKEVYPNLIQHNPKYPAASQLRSISFIGDDVLEHLKGLREKRWDLIPGAEITYSSEEWKDTQKNQRPRLQQYNLQLVALPRSRLL
ncbi:nucleoside hydrolase-like domain-containing protein [Autumnicola psychrophila]|uniref:DUF1593 domain-containing protein n=1 Tax=Autumnicola psychrophila TaxID=3075592 RepID=A0ABU3DXH6_9FLAO|nr:nucleoside hydrolase-like domain-containing protein [Zunongwangia sp. F225]MDT0687762.1 DUF1593 domain-containing protein [Zunongwangia sp. F225]